MKQYVCEAEIKKSDFDRINKLMDVMFEDYESDPDMHKLIDELDARRDTTPYSYYFDFEDHTEIFIHIRSGSSNYYDDCVLVSSDGQEDCVFDCSYKISEEMEFIYNDTSYICKFIIEED